jgi:acyl-CoA reductase-like NAD-dependent aldehyde dehydrogenase
MGTDRILAHSSIAPKLIEAMNTQLAAAAKSSDPLPDVVSAASKTRLAKLVSDALSHGAKLISGSADQSTPGPASFIPTILGDVPPQSQLFQEEAFGPVASVTTFDDVDKAIEFANSTPYGLSAAVFTRDLRRGFAIAKKLQSGAVHINSMTVHDEAALPMGGVKNSGWGRFNAEEGMEEFLVRKCVTWDD